MTEVSAQAHSQAHGQPTADVWPNFRGPNGLGVGARANPALNSGGAPGEQVVWKATLPKHGMSSPIVWKDRVFLTGADPDSRQVYGLDAGSGELLWKHDVRGLDDEPAGGTLPRVLEEAGFAAPTPTTNGEVVAAIFATGELVCVNFRGERVWAKHLGVPENHYGHASSLINDGERVYVQFDQSEGAKLLAFGLATGKLAWTADRDVIGWSSPILIDNGGRRELVLANSRAVDGYDPLTGARLWHVECLAGEVASSPAYTEGIVIVASEGAVAAAFDISRRQAEPDILWEWNEALPDASSPVASQGLVIIPTAFGVVSCLEAKTGKPLWEHEFDTGFSSSPIIVGDQVFLADLAGRMHVFKLSKAFEDSGRFDLGEATYATPAFAHDRIYVRTLHRLMCKPLFTK